MDGQRHEGYHPNERKISQLIFSGVLATVLTLAADVLLRVPMGLTDYPSVLGTMFDGGERVGLFSGIWWFSAIVSLILGGMVLPFVYDLSIYGGLFMNRPWIKGITMGAAVWVIAEGFVKPLAGLGFFSAYLGLPLTEVTTGLVLWLFYGVILERFTRVSYRQEFRHHERVAA